MSDAEPDGPTVVAPRLGARTTADIEGMVRKVLRGIENPEPPLDLRMVRELLELDRRYYSVTDDSALRETVSRLKVASKQVLRRPSLLVDAVRRLSLKALYLPDRKRILIDEALPEIKHRWNEAHEIGHSLIPWHTGMMLGDTDLTLTQSCSVSMEAEANYAAGQLLFLGERFRREAGEVVPGMAAVRTLKERYGNSHTSTLWRFVEQSDVPMLGLVSAHPHPDRRQAGFDPARPCQYCFASTSYIDRFGRPDPVMLFEAATTYCGPMRGGPLGADHVVLPDLNDDHHRFSFETFFNRYQALTLAWYLEPATAVFVVPAKPSGLRLKP